MASADQQASSSSKPEVALIVGGGPGISASCARLFAQSGMAVAIAARNPDKPVLQSLAQSHGVRAYGCDAADAADVASLFERVIRDLGAPRLVVHNIDPGWRRAWPGS
jgi:NAD(P)-dependent dehydrogenase (short-subunit alcohol dehydrogenase family)